jgi:hypothetical protein
MPAPDLLGLRRRITTKKRLGLIVVGVGRRLLQLRRLS